MRAFGQFGGLDRPNPALVALPDPIMVAPANRVTLDPASALPENAGVAIRVRLPLSDTPLSDAATISGRELGPTIVSMTTLVAADSGPTFPAASVA